MLLLHTQSIDWHYTISVYADSSIIEREKTFVYLLAFTIDIISSN
jgi:hypothetical protein